MSLKELINGQIIIIDDHKRGSKEIKNWDNEENDIHIDKSTNYPIDGKRQKVKIRIPINSQRPIKIENARNKKINLPNSLNREIKKALENVNTREAFVKDIIKVLKDFKTVLSDEDRAHQVLINLSNHFELNWTGEKISTIINNVLKSYTEVYQDYDGHTFFLKIDDEKIEIGENSGYSKQAKKINRK